MPRLILDAMGGDRGTAALLDGAELALPELVGELVLIGDEAKIREEIEVGGCIGLQEGIRAGKVRIVHASENIEMDDSIRAIRGKPGASINVGCRMAAEDWKSWRKGERPFASAFVSAGHSGAMMASALLAMGRLPGIERPAIAVKLPSKGTGGCVFLDAGANVECKPEHLRDFAFMGALFAQVDRAGGSLPKVAVLSNGEEPSKGTELTRAACALIAAHPCFAGGGPRRIGRFIGYIEGKELFRGTAGGADVVVTDGFVGNVVLKSLEGLGSTLTQFLGSELKKGPMSILGGILIRGVLKRLKKKLDYAEYGAAPLLGVAGYAFVCHGRSNARAIKNALLRAQSAVRDGFVARLESALAVTSERETAPARAET